MSISMSIEDPKGRGKAFKWAASTDILVKQPKMAAIARRSTGRQSTNMIVAGITTCLPLILQSKYSNILDSLLQHIRGTRLLEK